MILGIEFTSIAGKFKLKLSIVFTINVLNLLSHSIFIAERDFIFLVFNIQDKKENKVCDLSKPPESWQEWLLFL